MNFLFPLTVFHHPDEQPFARADPVFHIDRHVFASFDTLVKELFK